MASEPLYKILPRILSRLPRADRFSGTKGLPDCAIEPVRDRKEKGRKGGRRAKSCIIHDILGNSFERYSTMFNKLSSEEKLKILKFIHPVEVTF